VGYWCGRGPLAFPLLSQDLSSASRGPSAPSNALSHQWSSREVLISDAWRGGGRAGPWCLTAEQVPTDEPAGGTKPCRCSQPVPLRIASAPSCRATALYCCWRWWPPAPPQRPRQPQDLDVMQNTFLGSLPCLLVLERNLFFILANVPQFSMLMPPI